MLHSQYSQLILLSAGVIKENALTRSNWDTALKHSQMNLSRLHLYRACIPAGFKTEIFYSIFWIEMRKLSPHKVVEQGSATLYCKVQLHYTV